MFSISVGIILVTVGLIILIRIHVLLSCARCRSRVCLVGKTALITGGSSGIGFQTALNLASRGCKVIIADKNVSEDIRDKLIRETGNQNISLEFVDLISFSSVRRLAEKLKKSEKKLDILINNAGTGKGPDALTEDGLNSTIQINHYSSFLLTHLLVDLLKKSSSGRIVFTSSALSHFHNFSSGDAKNGKIKEKMKIFDYNNSKFMQIVVSDIFAMKLKKFNITSNAYHPGIVNTGIINQAVRDARGLWESLLVYFLLCLLFLYGKTPEEGAQTAIHLAISKDVEGVTGKYFGETTPTPKPRGAYNKAFCEGIWNASEVVVKLRPEEKL
ncbi:retinol dehydrogenase 14 isoform X2 [Leptinotarsa decemlineata]|uniref:retinol dehydrogenase 14 isoform X2 n=1 Tax=Leptinotarsa decemlineata TaxID=7539 RepID=UPI003D30BEA8